MVTKLHLLNNDTIMRMTDDNAVFDMKLVECVCVCVCVALAQECEVPI